MRTLMTCLMIVLISCQSTIKQKNDPGTQTDSTKSDLALKLNYVLPLSVEYLNQNKKDTFLLNLNNDRLLIAPNGKVIRMNKLFFEIRPKFWIKSLFIQPLGDDLIVFYVDSDAEGSESFAKKISPKQNK